MPHYMFLGNKDVTIFGTVFSPGVAVYAEGNTASMCSLCSDFDLVKPKDVEKLTPKKKRRKKRKVVANGELDQA